MEKYTRDDRPRIYYARVSIGETQEEFAAHVGIHPVTLSRLETWGVMAPGKGVARKIGAVTGQSAGEVIHDYEAHIPALEAQAS